MDFILDILGLWLGTKRADGMFKNYRDDPVQDLIKRNRQLEKKE